MHPTAPEGDAKLLDHKIRISKAVCKLVGRILHKWPRLDLSECPWVAPEKQAALVDWKPHCWEPLSTALPPIFSSAEIHMYWKCDNCCRVQKCGRGFEPPSPGVCADASKLDGCRLRQLGHIPITFSVSDGTSLIECLKCHSYVHHSQVRGLAMLCKRPTTSQT